MQATSDPINQGLPTIVFSTTTTVGFRFALMTLLPAVFFIFGILVATKTLEFEGGEEGNSGVPATILIIMGVVGFTMSALTYPYKITVQSDGVVSISNLFGMERSVQAEAAELSGCAVSKWDALHMSTTFSGFVLIKTAGAICLGYRQLLLTVVDPDGLVGAIKDVVANHTSAGER